MLLMYHKYRTGMWHSEPTTKQNHPDLGWTSIHPYSVVCLSQAHSLPCVIIVCVKLYGMEICKIGALVSLWRQGWSRGSIYERWGWARRILVVFCFISQALCFLRQVVSWSDARLWKSISYIQGDWNFCWTSS